LSQKYQPQVEMPQTGTLTRQPTHILCGLSFGQPEKPFRLALLKPPGSLFETANNDRRSNAADARHAGPCQPTVKFTAFGAMLSTSKPQPHCESSRDALHWIDGEWRCRSPACGNLAYPCRHRQRYCPSIARRARLLRKLARVPPQSLKAQALREMIAQQEAAMLAHVQRVNHDLKKRRQRYVR